MSRKTLTFRKSDVRRVVEAVRDAGIEIARIEIDTDGRITLTTGKPEPEQATDLDRWMAKHDAH